MPHQRWPSRSLLPSSPTLNELFPQVCEGKSGGAMRRFSGKTVPERFTEAEDISETPAISEAAMDEGFGGGLLKHCAFTTRNQEEKMESIQSRSAMNVRTHFEHFAMRFSRNDRLQSVRQWFQKRPGRRAEIPLRILLFFHRAERQIGLTPSAFSCFKRRETRLDGCPGCSGNNPEFPRPTRTWPPAE